MRSTKIFRYLLLITVALFHSSSSFAQENDSELSPPHPLRLQAGWWDYFKGSDAELAKRVDRAIRLVETEVSQTLTLDPIQTQHLVVYRENLNYLLSAEAKASGLTPLSTVIPQDCVNCSLDDFMILANLIREQTIALDSLREEVSIRQETRRRTEQHYNNILAYYIGLPEEAATERLTYGLEIMASRSSLYFQRHKIRLLKGQVEGGEERLAFLEEKLSLTQERLAPQPVDQELRAAISEAERQQKYARERLVRNQLRAASSDGEKQLTSDVNYAVTDIYRSLDLLSLRVQQGVREFYQDTSELSHRLPEWESELSRLSQQLEEWQEIARQRWQAITGLAAEEADPTRTELSDVVGTLTNARKARFAATMVLRIVSDRIQAEGTWLDSFKLYYSRVGEGMSELFQLMQRSLFTIGEVPITTWIIVRTLLTFLIAWQLSKAGQRAIIHSGTVRASSQGSGLYVVAKLFHYSIMTIAVIATMVMTGIDFTSFAIIGGALGIGIGFGLQGIVLNFICGLVIMFERNLKIGDRLEMEGIGLAKIVALNFQNTVVHARDGQDVIIPNGDLMNNRVVNWTLRDPFRRHHIPFSVAYGTDVDLVRECVVAAAEEAGKKVHDPQRPPRVVMMGFGDSAIDFELIVWANVHKYPGRRGVRTVYLEAINKTFAVHNINIPFPQREVYVSKGPPGGFAAKL